VIATAVIYSVSNIINAGVPFLMLPIMTRLLGPADYGVVAMFSSTVTILGAFIGLNIHGAIGIRYFQQDDYHLPSYIKSAFLLLFFSLAVVIAVLWAGASVFVSLTKLPLLWLLYAAIASCGQFLVLVLLVMFQMEGKPVQYGAFRIGQSLLDVGLSLLFVAALGGLWQGRAGGQALAVCIFGLLSLLLLYRQQWIAGTVRFKYIKNLLHFGVPLIPHTIGGLLIALFDRYIVSNILGAASAGIYMVGLQLAMALALISDAFAKAFGPWLNVQLKTNDEASRLRVVGAIYLSIIGFTALAVLAFLTLPAVFGLIFPGNYSGAKLILPYFIAGNAFMGMYYAVTNLIFFSAETYRISKITILVGVLSVCSTYFLVLNYGMEGAGLSYAASQFLLFVLVWREGAKLYPLPWRHGAKAVRLVLSKGRLHE